MPRRKQARQGFGEAVRRLRGEKGLGLRKFAAQVGLSPTYLSKIERGEFPPPAADKVIAIADALDQDRDTLLGLARRIPDDVFEAILNHPREISNLVRNANNLPNATLNWIAFIDLQRLFAQLSQNQVRPRFSQNKG